MSTANKVLIYRWFEEVWNKKRESAIYEMLDAKAAVYGLAALPTQAIIGPEGFVPFWRTFVTAFPNMTVSVESVLAEEDKIAARCSVRGRHTGKGMGEATDATIAFTGMCLGQVRDGKLVEAWNNFDFMTLYQQLGFIALPQM